MKLKSPFLFWPGILIILFLIIAYFITIEVDSGADYVAYSKLLGVLIFYNPIILILYIIIALFLIYKGIGRKIKFI